MKTALSQLAQGSVKISFGELRRNSPPGTFADNATHDQTLIEVPLKEILMRLDPALLPRRTNQRKIEVPDEVSGVFGPKGLVRSTTQPQAASPTAPPPAAAPALQPAITPVAPVMPVPPAAPAPKPPVSIPFNLPKPAAPSATSSAARGDASSVTISISAINPGWPDTVREEIERLNLQNLSVALPMNRLDQAMKTGRIIFTWNEIRSWIKPMPITGESPHLEVSLILPLSVIAPLFMAQHRPGKAQKTISIGENIPDLFSALAAAAKTAGETSVPASPVPLPAPVAPAPIAAAPLPAPAPVPVASIPVAPQTPAPAAPIPMPSKPASTLGEIFGQPQKSDWSPQEIAQKTSVLKGVAGSLIAMSDGLLVTSHMPATTKSETIGAFLPQIFGRMNQYAKELQFGDLSSLTLMVGNVPCLIVKTGSVYFVVLGRAGEEFPTAQLALISAEMAKRNK